jgi:hypothetical protein
MSVRFWEEYKKCHGSSTLHREVAVLTEPHKVMIDTDGITDEQKRSAKFQSAYQEPRSSFPAHGTPADKERAAEYEAGPYKGYGKKIQEAFAAIVPPDADAGSVADAIVKVVDAPGFV